MEEITKEELISAISKGIKQAILEIDWEKRKLRSINEVGE